MKFNNTSRNQVWSVEWDFGDGATSIADSPVHRYTVAGIYTVRLTARGPGGTDTRVMSDLVTVLPGRAVSLEVSPPEATVAVQESAQFSAAALDEFGNSVPGPITWSATAGGSSTDGDGRLTAGTVAGEFADAVTATFATGRGDIVGMASVTVEPGPLFEAPIDPSEVTLDIGDAQAFEVTRTDEFGNPIVVGLISWTVTQGVGELDDGGNFVARSTAGSFSEAVAVEVLVDGVRASATADVSIRPGPLATVEVEPSFVVMEEGLIQQFSASGFDEAGNEIPDLDFLWKASGGRVTQEGVFTAGAESGYHQVIATASFRDSTQSASAAVPIPPTWVPVGDMLSARHQHAAALLPNGKVLIVGGVSDTAELYDPVTRTFGPTGEPTCEHGLSPAATVLANGKVLVTGGTSASHCAEVYDPENGSFSNVGDLTADHWGHTATLLSDSTVLIAGGTEHNDNSYVSQAVAELYDATTETFTQTGSLNLGRQEHAAVLLPSGQVLVTGGTKYTLPGSPGPIACLAAPELYDHVTGNFSPIGDGETSVCHAGAALLDDGTVLITSNDGEADLFDASARTFRATGGMTAGRGQHTTTLLPTGEVLTSGGYTPVSIPAPEPPVFSEVVHWDFTLGTWGWRADKHVANMSTTPEGLQMESTGWDPILRSSDLDFPEGMDIRVTIRMKSTANDRAEFNFWERTGGEGLIYFNPDPDGQWHEYELVFPSPGFRTNMRLDPATAPGDITIACVNVESFIPPETLPRQLVYETFDFWDFTDWTQGWLGGDHVKNLTVTGEGLNFESVGWDPILEHPQGLPVPEGESIKFAFRMKSSANETAEFQYYGPTGSVKQIGVS